MIENHVKLWIILLSRHNIPIEISIRNGGVLLVANAETRAAAATSSSLPLILSEMSFCFSFICGVVAVDDNAASLSPLHVVIVSVGFPP